MAQAPVWVSNLLSFWSLSANADEIWNDPTGAALLAQAVNASAKAVNPQWYDHKAAAVTRAVELNNFVDYDEAEGVVYIQTPFGQVSFHMIDEVNETIETATRLVPMKWDGLRLQEFAIGMLAEHLDQKTRYSQLELYW